MKTDLKNALLWFRHDLRLKDHPALLEACHNAKIIVPLYVFDTQQTPAYGAASRWWLHHSLEQLSQAFKNKNSQLVLKKGAPETIIKIIIKEHKITHLYFQKTYDRYGRALEDKIKKLCDDLGIECEAHAGALLHDPATHLGKTSKAAYKVFTPFWRSLRADFHPQPLLAPRAIPPCPAIKSDDLLKWKLRPTKPNWANDGANPWEKIWQPGEEGAHRRLKTFIKTELHDYKDGRNFPARQVTSRLSPHLHFGEITPTQVAAAIMEIEVDDHELKTHAEKYLAEIGWRDFSYHLLFHHPELPHKNYVPQFDKFKWQTDSKALKAWQTGQTGYPIVDAAMRQMWQKGWMHNRMRMVTASFLIKDLLIDWRIGADWFWDCLVDADIANNAASWQWVAGSGADASPYFRIFNPILQSRKFDANGDYIRAFVPELKDLPNKYLHAPFEAPPEILEKYKIKLGKTYPKPIVDHGKARDYALAAYREMRN